MQLNQSWKMGVMAMLVSATGALAGAAVPTFIGLGDVPGGSYESNPTVVSADGKVVAGYSYGSSGRKEPFRWTAATGIVSLGALPASLPIDSDVTGLSADGSVVIGTYTYRGTYDDFGVPVAYTAQHGFYWTQATGEVDIPNPVERGACGVYCTSADGQTFFGTYTPVLTPPYPAAGKWTASTGWTPLTGPLPTSVNGNGYVDGVYGCSGDGSVVIGSWYDPDGASASQTQAFRWTAETGYVLLGNVPGDVLRYALGVSRDGTTIVGQTFNGLGFRWKLGEGALLLGDLPGGANQSIGLSTNADGSIVVGYSATGGSSSTAGDQAFIWDATNGIRNLKTVLINAGTPTVSTWKVLRGYRMSISPDGRFITGLGRNPSSSSEAFLVDFGAPPCLADFNGDTVRDVADLFGYINAWLAKTGNADFNHDTIVDVADLFGYINAWLAGC